MAFCVTGTGRRCTAWSIVWPFLRKTCTTCREFSYIGTILRWICVMRKSRRYIFNYSVCTNRAIHSLVLGNWEHSSQVPEAPHRQSNISGSYVSVVSSWFIIAGLAKSVNSGIRNCTTLFWMPWHISPQTEKPAFNCREHFAHLRGESWLD